MIMRRGTRKAMLTLHVTTSIGLLGAVAGFLALAVAGLTSGETGLARAAYPGMDLLVRTVIVPLAWAALLIGIVQSLGTRWGLIRHYWLVAKLILTGFALTILLLQLGTIERLAIASNAGEIFDAALFADRLSLIVHSAAGLAVLLIPAALSIYKPIGRTPFRRRLIPAPAA